MPNPSPAALHHARDAWRRVPPAFCGRQEHKRGPLAADRCQDWASSEQVPFLKPRRKPNNPTPSPFLHVSLPPPRAQQLPLLSTANRAFSRASVDAARRLVRDEDTDDATRWGLCTCARAELCTTTLELFRPAHLPRRGEEKASCWTQAARIAPRVRYTT